MRKGTGIPLERINRMYCPATPLSVSRQPLAVANVTRMPLPSTPVVGGNCRELLLASLREGPLQ